MEERENFNNEKHIFNKKRSTLQRLIEEADSVPNSAEITVSMPA